YQLQPYLPLQLGTDEGPAKPHPALMYRACQALGVAPEATLVVGDALADVQMAEAAGAAGCIGAVWGWTQPPALEQADVLANHCSQIQIDPQF
ncbi:MAG TPA: HAD-IA family hydrolase, partial [Allocoleopsis sp.]